MALPLTARLTRWSSAISAVQPQHLEGLVRALLVQYFFHVSDRSIVEVVGLPEGERPALALLAPTRFRGSGRIRVTPTTVFGWVQSPFSYRCGYVEARNPDSVISIGANTTLNNACVLLAEGAGIRIGDRCLIGTEFQAMDTNAHELALGQRHRPDSRTALVDIGNDVFIGSRVTVLKGSRIGAGCVIAAGTVVVPGFEAPPGSIVAGNPARVVGQVPSAAP
jgi:maltose O-acetyltransferase